MVDIHTASYNNTLGMYTYSNDGTIGNAELVILNAHQEAGGTSHTYDVPAGQSVGFFVIADGAGVNGNYGGLDLNNGTLQLVYHYNHAGQRAANISDNANDVSLVYTDGDGDVHVLNGDVYHSTTRDSTGLSLNSDGDVHVKSGMVADVAGPATGEALRVGFEDLPGLGDRDFDDLI